jgi:diadenosine tetraphosphate (Ap4A) HIT family hydrolase
MSDIVNPQPAVDEAVKRGRGDELREVFVSNIPYDVSSAGLEAALKRLFGKSGGYLGIRKMMIPKGFAIIEFDSNVNALAAIENSTEVKLGPRKLFVKLSDPDGAKRHRMEKESHENSQRNKGFEQDTHPNPDCWFCLANPSFDQAVVYAVDEGTHVYSALAKGGITKFHSLIAPVTHYGCYAAASGEVRAACDGMVERLQTVMKSMDRDVVYYERWIPLNANAANHMQIHVVPISKGLAIDWSSIVKEKGKESDIEFLRITSHKDVTDKMKGILNRVSYLFMSFPPKDDSEPRETWLGIGRMTFTFPREVLCKGLALPDRVDWKNCTQDSSFESEQSQQLRGLFYKVEA